MVYRLTWELSLCLQLLLPTMAVMPAINVLPRPVVLILTLAVWDNAPPAADTAAMAQAPVSLTPAVLIPRLTATMLVPLLPPVTAVTVLPAFPIRLVGALTLIVVVLVSPVTSAPMLVLRLSLMAAKSPSL